MGKCIMVIDDSSAIRNAVRVGLELKDYSVIEAVDDPV